MRERAFHPFKIGAVHDGAAVLTAWRNMDMKHFMVHDRLNGIPGHFKVIIYSGNGDAMVRLARGVFTGALIGRFRCDCSPAQKAGKAVVEKSAVEHVEDFSKIPAAPLCRHLSERNSGRARRRRAMVADIGMQPRFKRMTTLPYCPFIFRPTGGGKRGPFYQRKFYPLRSVFEPARHMEFSMVGIAMYLYVPVFSESGTGMDGKFRTATLCTELVEGAGRIKIEGELFDGIG